MGVLGRWTRVRSSRWTATNDDVVLGHAGFTGAQRIGAGTSSVVYRARELSLDRNCAVKVFNLPLDDAIARRRFERELAITGSLGVHPNIVTVYRIGTLGDGRGFVAMEYCAGGPVRVGSSDDQLMSVQDSVGIAIRVTGALETAHRAGVLHRDIKPHNILLRRGNDPAVADFGVAVLISDMTVTTHAMTPAHAAPEVLGGEPASPASDQWSLASTLYEMLSGSPPFGSIGNEGALAWAVRAMEAPLAPIGRLDVPASLAAVIERAMAKDGGDRWESMQSFGEALQTVQREQGWAMTSLDVLAIGDGEPATPVEHPQKQGPLTKMRSVIPEPGEPIIALPHKSRSVVLAVATVAVVACLVVGAVLFTQHSSPHRPKPVTASSASTTETTTAGHAPTNVHLVSDTGTAVSLAWTDPYAGQVTYVIDTTETAASIRPVQSAQQPTSAVVSGLEPDHKYCFSVGAVYAFGSPPAYAPPVCRP